MLWPLEIKVFINLIILCYYFRQRSVLKTAYFRIKRVYLLVFCLFSINDDDNLQQINYLIVRWFQNCFFLTSTLNCTNERVHCPITMIIAAMQLIDLCISHAWCKNWHHDATKMQCKCTMMKSTVFLCTTHARTNKIAPIVHIIISHTNSFRSETTSL